MSNLVDVQIDLANAPATLRAVLLHRPDAHPHWHRYMVLAILDKHLTPRTGP